MRSQFSPRFENDCFELAPPSRLIRPASPTTHHCLIQMHDYLHHTLYLTLCGVGVVVHRQTQPAPGVPNAGGAISPSATPEVAHPVL
jgi:hypothetical protein